MEFYDGRIRSAYRASSRRYPVQHYDEIFDELMSSTEDDLFDNFFS